MSLIQTVTMQQQVEELQALPLRQHVQGLCKLATSHDQPTTGAARVLLQSALCQALLATLEPPTPSMSGAAAVGNSVVTAEEVAANVWPGGSEALERMYTWEDEEVVLSVIQFWGSVSNSLLHGGTSAPQQQQQCGGGGEGATAVSTQHHASASADGAAHPTSVSPSVQPPPQPELQYLTWLLTLGPATVGAVVQQLHRFWQLTGVNHFQHQHKQQHQQQQQRHQSLTTLLLLFLDLCDDDSIRSSSSSSCGGAAAQQVLQLLHNRTTTTTADSLPCVWATLTASQAFSGVSCLLQAAAQLQQAPAPSAGGGICRPAAATSCCVLRMVDRAGSMLRHWYGWCGFGEMANMPAAAAAAAAEAGRQGGALDRPSSIDSLYDCFMLLLAQQVLAGPTPISCSSMSNSATASTATAEAEQPSVVAGSSSCSDDDWEMWLDSNACSTLATLVATYDRPEVLVRGLYMLTQQQLTAQENAAAVAAETATAAAGSGHAAATGKSKPIAAAAAAKKAAKVVQSRVLLLLKKVFLGRQQQQEVLMAAGVGVGVKPSSSCEAAGAVGQLLLGLSELLRPAANCSVDWRCGALAAMLSAVEDFKLQQQQQQEEKEDAGNGSKELQLWSEASVDALLYCASHDPSIQARRAAVQLLEHVVLPISSSRASALVCCVADKLSDKDSGVATAALHLFVQLEPRVVCNTISGAQWCAAVQAGLELLSAGGGGRKGGSKQLKPAVKAQFVQQLRSVLQGAALPAGTSQLIQGGRVVGIAGCKQIVLSLMQEADLVGKWEELLRAI